MRNWTLYCNFLRRTFLHHNLCTQIGFRSLNRIHHIHMYTNTIAVNAIIIFVVYSIVWKITIGSWHFILEDASHCFITEKLPPNDGRGRKYCWLKLVKVFWFRSFSDTPGKPRRLRIEISAINTVPTTAQKTIYWKGMNILCINLI